MGSLLFERVAKNKSPEQVLELARKGQQVSVPDDVLKDPFVLEFADLRDNPAAQERDLEQAILDRLEDFLLEMGKGFCSVARQKRLTLEGDHFYVDLVFYNRLLCCFVLVDLKMGKLSHQDLGQMQMYLNFFDRFQRGVGRCPIHATRRQRDESSHPAHSINAIPSLRARRRRERSAFSHRGVRSVRLQRTKRRSRANRASRAAVAPLPPPTPPPSHIPRPTSLRRAGVTRSPRGCRCRGAVCGALRGCR